MQTKPSFNFKNHQSKKFSRWYLLRVVIYLIFLTVGVYLLYNKFQKQDLHSVDVKEIRGIQIEE